MALSSYSVAVTQNPSQPDPVPPADWIDLCALDDVPTEGGLFIEHEMHGLAVFRVGNHNVRVMNDRCPHAGGSLASGRIEGDYVICPWHCWPFDVVDGRCPDNPSRGVQTYPARVVEERVQIKFPIRR